MQIDKTLILNNLIQYYSNGNKSHFARLLDIKPQTLASWLSRNTFDIDLIYSKCENINAKYLLTGKGSIIEDKQESINLANEPEQYYNDYRQKYYDLLEKYNACLEEKDKMRVGITHTPAVYQAPNKPKLKS